MKITFFKFKLFSYFCADRFSRLHGAWARPYDST